MIKKTLQHFGSWVVRIASNTDIPDAPSGFRAISREAALRINVTNEYTYTLETIVQAGRERIPMTHVPIRTNGELRPSRLFNSMSSYVQKSMVTIIRAYIMYKPLKFFTCVGAVPFLIGTVLGIRYLILLTTINATGHIQSLILSSVLLLMGFITFIIGLMADILAKNRMILEDIQYHVRKIDYEGKENIGLSIQEAYGRDEYKKH